MTKVEITNFQSIKHIVFEFDGFAGIVGTNFIGKSAILRAMDAALRNRGGTDFIRWGESFCEVKITRPGLELVWHKEEGHNFYIINGETFKKIGRGEVPYPLERLRYDPVKVLGEKINLTYADQFNPLFLVDRTGSASTDLLTSIYNLDQIYKAKEICDGYVRTNKGKVSFKEKDFEFSKQEVGKFEGFPKVKADFEALSKAKAGLEAFEKEIEKIKKYMADLTACLDKIKKYKQIQNIAFPDSTDLEASVTSLDDISKYRRRLIASAETVKKLSAVSQVNLPDESYLSPASKEIETLKIYKQKLKDLYGVVTSLKAVKDLKGTDIQDPATIQSEINTLRSYTQRILVLTASIKKSEPVKDIPDINVPDLDIPGLDKLKRYGEALRSGAVEVNGYKKELAVVLEEEGVLHDGLSGYKNCPACGHTLSLAA